LLFGRQAPFRVIRIWRLLAAPIALASAADAMSATTILESSNNLPAPMAEI
jgi:hypothetical protein